MSKTWTDLIQCHHGMELHQLRYLVLLSEERNFTRAAGRAHIAQPALSRQIRKLEEELGTSLVDRTSRRVRMTAAGSALTERARRILAEVDEARAEARDERRLLTGRVLIGISQTPGPLDAAGLLRAFHDLHPGIELAVREGLSLDLAQRLREDDLDVAFVSAIDATLRDQLVFHPLARERLVLIVRSDHRLAGAKTTSVRRLAGERLVAFPRGATIRESVAQAARLAGFEPNVAFESNDVTRTRALVAQGLGVAVLPASDLVDAGPEVSVVSLRDRELVHEIFVAWRSARRLSPAAAAFLKLVRDEPGLSLRG